MDINLFLSVLQIALKSQKHLIMISLLTSTVTWDNNVVLLFKLKSKPQNICRRINYWLCITTKLTMYDIIQIFMEFKHAYIAILLCILFEYILSEIRYQIKN